jgi:hypothetical protein
MAVRLTVRLSARMSALGDVRPAHASGLCIREVRRVRTRELSAAEIADCCGRCGIEAFVSPVSVLIETPIETLKGLQGASESCSGRGGSGSPMRWRSTRPRSMYP